MDELEVFRKFTELSGSLFFHGFCGMHRRRRDADGNAYNLLFKIKALTDNREKTLAELAKIDELLDDLSRDPG